MRGLFWVILLAALAVALTLGARYNEGYVLFVLHPYRVELSLNLLLASCALLFAAAYFFVRVIVNTLRLPSSVRRFREERRHRRAQRSLLEALRAYLEGRYAKAEKAASRTVELRDHAGFGAVIAARAAHELRAADRRDRYLARAAHFSDEDQVMRFVAQAELLLQERRHQEALAALERLPHKHTAALRLELRAVQLARNWDRYLELLSQLERLRALDEVQVSELRRFAICENIARKARDMSELREYWKRLAQGERYDARIAAEAARAFIAHEQWRDAQPIIESSLERAWDSQLAGLYADCSGDDTVRQIERAEKWLTEQSEDASLLLTLGRLCARQRLWGKARSYLEASLSLEESFEAVMALAQLLEEVGESDAAQRSYRRALALAQSQLGQRAASIKESRSRLAAAPTRA